MKSLDELTPRILQMYSEGISTNQIGRALEVSQSFVLKVLRDCNVERRTRTEASTKALNEKFDSGYKKVMH